MGTLPELMVAYFLRHADAELRADSDYQRRLTPKGLEQADKVGKFFVRCGLLPQLILTSPIVRALQTAKIVAENLEKAEFSEAAWLACGMTAETCLMELKAVRKKLRSCWLATSRISATPSPRWLGSKMLRRSRSGASLTGVELLDFQAGQGQLHFLVPARLM